MSKLIRSAIEAKDKVATIRLGFTNFATLGINVCAIARSQQFSSNSIQVDYMYARLTTNFRGWTR
jgi:hypothetical protein